jgi:hypothetical protein
VIAKLSALANAARLPLTITSPRQFLPAHDAQITAATFNTYVVIACLSSALVLIIFAEPFTSLLTLLTCISVVVGTIGLGNFNVKLIPKLLNSRRSVVGAAKRAHHMPHWRRPSLHNYHLCTILLRVRECGQLPSLVHGQGAVCTSVYAHADSRGHGLYGCISMGSR